MALEETVEMIQLIPKGRISEGIDEQTVDVSVHEIWEQTVEVLKVIRRERLHQRAVEQSGHVPVPQSIEEIVEGVQTIPQERILERVRDQFVDVPVPQLPEDVVEVAQLVPQVRMQAEQIGDDHVPHMMEFHMSRRRITLWRKSWACLLLCKVRCPRFMVQRSTETWTRRIR